MRVLVQEISHDTKKFRFGLPSAAHILGLPVGTETALLSSLLFTDEILHNYFLPTLLLSKHLLLISEQQFHSVTLYLILWISSTSGLIRAECRHVLISDSKYPEILNCSNTSKDSRWYVDKKRDTEQQKVALSKYSSWCIRDSLESQIAVK